MSNSTHSGHPFPIFATGLGASKGIAVGKFWVWEDEPQKSGEEKALRQFEGVEIELGRFDQAFKQVYQKLERLTEKARIEIGEEEAAIFEAHQMMLQDDELSGSIRTLIRDERQIPENAISSIFSSQIQIFETADTEYLRARSLDLKDLRMQMLTAIAESFGKKQGGLAELQTPVILVAEDLTPSQTVSLDSKNILGMITEKGGSTSHSAIIARALGIPAIVGVSDARKIFRKFPAQAKFAMDGDEGTVFDLTDLESKNYFYSKAEAQKFGQDTLKQFVGRKSVTRDGIELTLSANIGSVKDLKAVREGDADGVGLFRTEFLFMEREHAPTLDEQRVQYHQILNELAPRDVVIRTLDVGGDKAIPYIQISPEENPFLGVRAIRYCMLHPEFFKTQIKAMLLANENGNLSILIPMISRATEAKAVCDLIHSCHRELQADPKYSATYRAMPYRIGAMVEIPAIAFELREISRYVSFISVGTNDLLQYSVAVDRMNPELLGLYSPYNLGFLRLMKLIADEGSQAGLELGICGELGGNEEFIPLWIAMGFRKLSMTPTHVLAARSQASQLTRVQCESLLLSVLQSQDELGVRQKLK